MKNFLNKLLFFLFIGFLSLLLSSCIIKKSNSLSFKELMRIDSISQGELGTHINNFLKLPELYYYEIISNKNEIYRIIKETTDKSRERDLLFQNYQCFSFEKLDKTTLSVFYKDTFLTVINGFDYCYKPYQNGETWNNVLFFDKDGKSILNKEKLQRKFRQLLISVYRSSNENSKPLIVLDGVTEYNQRYLLEYMDNVGLNLLCEDVNIDSLCYRQGIENMCEDFAKKHHLSKILFDVLSFECI